MPRTLKFHAMVDDKREMTCTIWITDGNRTVAEQTSGMTVRVLDIQDFFMKHRSLMLVGHPYEISTCLVNFGPLEIPIADDLTAYRELGLNLTADETSGPITA